MGNQKCRMEKWGSRNNEYGKMRHGKKGVWKRIKVGGGFQRRRVVGKWSRVGSLKRGRKWERQKKVWMKRNGAKKSGEDKTENWGHSDLKVYVKTKQMGVVLTRIPTSSMISFGKISPRGTSLILKKNIFFFCLIFVLQLGLLWWVLVKRGFSHSWVL